MRPLCIYNHESEPHFRITGSSLLRRCHLINFYGRLAGIAVDRAIRTGHRKLMKFGNATCRTVTRYAFRNRTDALYWTTTGTPKTPKNYKRLPTIVSEQKSSCSFYNIPYNPFIPAATAAVSEFTAVQRLRNNPCL